MSLQISANIVNDMPPSVGEVGVQGIAGAEAVGLDQQLLTPATQQYGGLLRGAPVPPLSVISGNLTTYVVEVFGF